MRVRKASRGEPPLDEGRKAEIFAAAIAVFDARGLDAARLSEIARNASVSVATLRREFGDKDGLFRAAARSMARAHVERICSELPAGPATAQLRNFCGRCWELLRIPAFAWMYRFTVAEAPRFPELARFYADEVYAPLQQSLARIIERGVVQGTFRATSYHAAARLIVSALVQQAFWCNHADVFGPELAGGCHRVVAETLSIVLGGMSPHEE